MDASFSSGIDCHFPESLSFLGLSSSMLAFPLVLDEEGIWYSVNGNQKCS